MESGLRVRLQCEERQALDQFRAARERFDRILAEVPSGIPQPDGNLRIQRAGQEVRHFNRLSSEASKRLLDYMVRGVVPEGYREGPPERLEVTK